MLARFWCCQVNTATGTTCVSSLMRWLIVTTVWRFWSVLHHLLYHTHGRSDLISVCLKSTWRQKRPMLCGVSSLSLDWMTVTKYERIFMVWRVITNFMVLADDVCKGMLHNEDLLHMLSGISLWCAFFWSYDAMHWLDGTNSEYPACPVAALDICLYFRAALWSDACTTSPMFLQPLCMITSPTIWASQREWKTCSSTLYIQQYSDWIWSLLLIQSTLKYGVIILFWPLLCINSAVVCLFLVTIYHCDVQSWWLSTFFN